MMTKSSYRQISSLIRKCRYDETDVDRRAELLKQINTALPKRLRIQLPSLITNDYVTKALDMIEDRLTGNETAIAI
jgi:hypothetical protein